MPSYQSIEILGHAVRDCEVVTTSTGKEVAKITVAVGRGKDKSGNDLGADFFRVSIFNNKLPTGEDGYIYSSVSKTKKGDLVNVTGTIKLDPVPDSGSVYANVTPRRFYNFSEYERKRKAGAGQYGEDIPSGDVPEANIPF